MKCPNCQSENRDGAKYCDECGFPLSGRIAAVAAAAEEGEGDALVALADTSATGERADDAPGGPSPESPDAIDIPSIDVIGVNVDENGNAFDCTYAPEDDAEDFSDDGAFEKDLPAEDFSEDGNLFEPQEGLDFAPLDDEYLGERDDDRFAEWDSDRTADLSGIERLVDPGYVPPASAWRTGDTMEMPAQGETPSGSPRDFRAPDPNAKKRRRPRKGAVVAILVALLAVGAAAAATYHMELWGGCVVPDVVGKSQADATYELEAKGFSVKAMQVKSDDVEGKVLLTDPSAGSRQAQGAQVVIHVSAARVVPEVVGLPRDEAVELFKEEGLENVEYETEFSDAAKGSVLSVDPEAGEKVKASTHIVVKIATPYTVPNVVGKTSDEAQATLSDASFVPNVVQVYDESVKEGQVVSTDPEAGAELPSGSTVTVNVAKSRSAELVSVTHTYFQSSAKFSIDGVTYEVNPDTLDVSYVGDNTTKYTISARVVETHDYLFFGTQTLYGEWKAVSGTITWGDDNGVAASSPQIARV